MACYSFFVSCLILEIFWTQTCHQSPFESFVQPVKADTVLDTRASVHESFRTLTDDFGFIICTY